MMKKAYVAVVLLSQLLHCLASDDSPFELTNRATGFCLVKTNHYCFDIRWTTGDRLLVPQRKKCLGVQGKSVGSEIGFYDCDENSELQKWECRNETVLALKDQELYIELTADNTAALSRTIGPNNHLTISGTTSGACSRTYRELYAIGGNAAGMLCMFPFKYKDVWYSDCTTVDSENYLWCAVETQYQSEHWGYCPGTSKAGWNRHPITGAYYQLNTQAALTWPQAESSCRQQHASLLNINDPHEQAYVIALLGKTGTKLWIGMVLEPEHGWKWANGRPYRYVNWDSGHPLTNSGHNCGIADPEVQYSWQSSPCSKKLGYICTSKGEEELPTQAAETGFCSTSHWIPYNGHCFYLNRTQKTWSDAQRQCRDEGGDLVSIRNVEDQSFIISQLGYISTDELWIGLNDRKTEGLFDWTDHSTVSFTSWQYGNPIVSGDENDCVLMRGETGNWADLVCEEKRGFICMKSGVSKSTGAEVESEEGCKTGWRRHYSYCYYIGSETKTFHEAKLDCRRSNSYLADVSNGVDNAFLVSLVGMRPEKHFWLGLSNQRHIGDFEWTSSKSVTFTHWNTFMPGRRQGCVAIKTGIFAGLWDVLPCTNREKYICKHLAEGARPTPPPPIIAHDNCANGWSRMEKRNYCVRLFTMGSDKSRTWFQARDFCSAIGGDLLSIHSADDLQTLQTFHSWKPVWIGLSAPDPARGYVWSDGSPLQFQHWKYGEPNNKYNVESCATISLNSLHSNGSWNDIHCEKPLAWFCQIRTGFIPNPAPSMIPPDYNTTKDGWLEWNGNQYLMVKRSSLAAESARNFCKMRHSDLVTINSEAEGVFLWKQISQSERNFWIGLNVDLDGTCSWMDGSPVEFQRWNENQPHFLNNDENCAVMTAEMGFWHVYNCGRENQYICKRSGTPWANATVAPTVLAKGGCPQNWDKFDSKCYIVKNNENKTWLEARTECQSMGGNLASILSRQVQVYLTTKMAEAPSTDLWIGLYTQKSYEEFYWTDGRPKAYNYWGFPQVHHHFHYHDRRMSFMNEGKCTVMSTDRRIGIGKWIKRSCNDTNGYICLRNVDPSLPDTPATTTADYVKVSNEFFKVVRQEMDWDSAKKNCERDGAKLASFHSEWSRFHIELQTWNLQGPMWIGLAKKEASGYFRYVDGRPIPFTNWAPGEPRMNQACVYVDQNGLWRCASCLQHMASICMKSTDVPPTESSEYPGHCPENPEKKIQVHPTRETESWMSFKGYCYIFFKDRDAWAEASTHCIKHGGTLASIEDQEEQQFIQRRIQLFQDSTDAFWIGLYKTHKGMWLWLDKTVMRYVNWATNQEGESSYGEISTLDGKWHGGQRWFRRPYICKTPKVLEQTPQTTQVTLTVDHHNSGNINSNMLAVGLVITVIVIGIVIAVFLFKRSGRRFPSMNRSSTYDNPLFYEQSQPEPVNPKKTGGEC